MEAKLNDDTRPGKYDDIFVFVPGTKEIVRIAMGCGDNLSKEDIENGYVDYIYFDQHELSNGLPEIDGGMVLLKEILTDKYQCIVDCIPDVLEIAYGSSDVEHKILA